MGKTIRRYLPHLLNGFLPFKIYNHTDLMRGPSNDGRDFPSEFAQMKEQADSNTRTEPSRGHNKFIVSTSWAVFSRSTSDTVSSTGRLFRMTTMRLAIVTSQSVKAYSASASSRR